MQSALLHFESAAFGVDPGEDEATNPGIFGRALAEWVRDRLRERGLPAEEVIAEDFGWCVPVRLEPHAVYVACASEEERSGSWAWQLFVFAEGGLLQRLLGKDTRREAMDRVFGAVREALASSTDIHNLTEEPA
ncbi:MAG TPA: hypothetical protein VFO31_00490 [Vicinamibacterales bacterium]|nr:hypothetical protein [Vicinamibacterales bacterium]